MPATVVLIVALALALILVASAWGLRRVSRELSGAAGRTEKLVRRLERQSAVTAELELGQLREERDSLAGVQSSLRVELGQVQEERDSLVGAQAELMRELTQLQDAHEKLTVNRNQLECAYEALEAKLEQVESAQASLRQQIARLRQTADQNRQLYLLLRSLLDEHELLRAARTAMTSRSAPPPRFGESGASPSERSSIDEGLAQDDAGHRNAARVARVMVADLFLYNRNLLLRSSDQATLRARLNAQFDAACETFQARVPERVWKQRHYLRLEFERVLRERTAEAGSADEALASTGSQAAPAEKLSAEGQASRVARLMVADLLLSNLPLVEEGIREGRLAQALAAPFEEARREFETRVPESVLRSRHHLQQEFERVLRELGVRHSLDTELDQLMSAAFRPSSDAPAA